MKTTTGASKDMGKSDDRFAKAYIDANIPQVASGFAGDCKWQFYMPSGGYEFQKDFTEYWIPHFDAKIASLNDERVRTGIAVSKFSDAKRKMSDVRNALIAVREYLEANKAVKQEALRVSGVAAEYFEKDFEWIATAPEKAHGIWTAMSAIGELNAADGKDISTNIGFLVAFRDFFLVDRGFDILMWMASVVDAKYRTKVSRECYRLVREQMIRMAQISNCNTPLALTYKMIFSQPLDILSGGTQTAFNALREAKKRGIPLGSKSSDDDLRSNLHRLERNARWDIVRP